MYSGREVPYKNKLFLYLHKGWVCLSGGTNMSQPRTFVFCTLTVKRSNPTHVDICGPHDKCTELKCIRLRGTNRII